MADVYDARFWTSFDGSEGGNRERLAKISAHLRIARDAPNPIKTARTAIVTKLKSEPLNNRSVTSRVRWAIATAMNTRDMQSLSFGECCLRSAVLLTLAEAALEWLTVVEKNYQGNVSEWRKRYDDDIPNIERCFEPPPFHGDDEAPSNKVRRV